MTVAPLVAEGTIRSLDGGRVVRAGGFDVPCLRHSWAEETRVDSPGAVRRIDDPYSDGLHPAAQVAFDFFGALGDGDAHLVHALSTHESRELTPDALLAAWRDALGDAAGPRIAIKSGVYRLDPHPGVGVRLMHEAPPIPVRVDAPTHMWAAEMIPLLPQEKSWRADLGLARLDVNWPELLRTAPPP
ncbi:MAG: hypothetical protein ACXVH3_35560 [Solirubrobacteraceae bacterium]